MMAFIFIFHFNLPIRVKIQREDVYFRRVKITLFGQTYFEKAWKDFCIVVFFVFSALDISEMPVFDYERLWANYQGFSCLLTSSFMFYIGIFNVYFSVFWTQDFLFLNKRSCLTLAILPGFTNSKTHTHKYS